jgi:hypothetical protein
LPIDFDIQHLKTTTTTTITTTLILAVVGVQCCLLPLSFELSICLNFIFVNARE